MCTCITSSHSEKPLPSVASTPDAPALYEEIRTVSLAGRPRPGVRLVVRGVLTETHWELELGEQWQAPDGGALVNGSAVRLSLNEALSAAQQLAEGGPLEGPGGSDDGLTPAERLALGEALGEVALSLLNAQRAYVEQLATRCEALETASASRRLTPAEVEALTAAAEAFFAQEGLCVETGWFTAPPGGTLAIEALEALASVEAEEVAALAPHWEARKAAVLGGRGGRLVRLPDGGWALETRTAVQR